MNRQTVKMTIFILNLIVSGLCIFLLIYGKIKNNSFLGYDSKLFRIHIYLFYFNMFFCIIGIILFLRYLIFYDDKIFIKIYLLLIPSIIVAIVILYSIIMILVNNLFFGGMIMPALISAIGMPLFVFFYLNQKYNIVIKIMLSLLFPVNILFSGSLMWLLMML